jgi:hypothetical protein
MLPEERDAAYLWDMLSAAREVPDPSARAACDGHSKFVAYDD